MAPANEILPAKSFRNEYHRATVNVIFTGKCLMQFSSDILKPYKLSLQQFNILNILRKKYPGAVTIKYIRERMPNKMSDTSRIVETLRKKGFIDRDLNEENRRSVDVVITEKGRSLLDEIEKENEPIDKRLYALNEEEIRQLNYLLDKAASA